MFKDKIAVITGGGSGIGRATALALAKAGAHVGIGTPLLAKSAGGNAHAYASVVPPGADRPTGRGIRGGAVALVGCRVVCDRAYVAGGRWV